MDRFLCEVLPRRFEVGHGQVHGVVHRSREADVILWDALNYPRLQLRGSTIFFAESVRASIEVKSRWSVEELDDILVKTKALRDIVTAPRINIDDALQRMQLDIAYLAGGPAPTGALAVQHRIGTAGFVFFGGQRFELKDVKAETMDHADDCWPDVLLFLEAGIVVLKEWEEREGLGGGQGELLRFDLGADALLFFTDALLRGLVARSVFVETPLDLASYQIPSLHSQPVERVSFRLTRPNPGRRYFFDDE
ncbi:hypothetical protein K7C98_06145 [Nannocystis pusilla]|uniref:DUF6602 domain-containing protein n=1 Tax=Nannocystis pusilla TaxID=889268 RepID=A0ABS7TKS8_9BACT|nr:DUF6602 domain-containing protein [Nannocystis pusilla]MBZ5708829.1 hypothetical protein [Nannocystis pusilla]